MSPLMTLIVIMLVYLALVFLMFREWFTPLWALPLLAFMILAVAEIAHPGTVALKDVYDLAENGPSAIVSTIMMYIFGTIFARTQIQTGIVENVVKRAAELGGDKPLLVTILLGLATAYVTVGAFGGGAILCIIIALPILLSFGLDKRTAAVIIGSACVITQPYWMSLWGMYTGITKITINDMNAFVLPYMVSIFIVWVVFAVYSFKKKGAVRHGLYRRRT